MAAFIVIIILIPFFKFSVLSAQFSCYLPVDLCQQKPTIKNTYTLFLLLILFLSGAVQLERRTAALKSCQRKQFALQFLPGFIFQLSLGGSLFSFYFSALCFVINVGQQ